MSYLQSNKYICYLWLQNILLCNQVLESGKKKTCLHCKSPLTLFLFLYHFTVHIIEWSCTSSSKSFPAHASKVIAIKDYTDDSCLELFGNNIVQYNIQACTEIHEKGGKGCPGIVTCIFILQHQEGKANVEGYKADEYLSNQSDYNSYGSLLGLRLQFGSLAVNKIINND